MKVIYAGTFNFFHAGHHHVYKQACKMFGKDNVYLCVAENQSKEVNIDFIKWTLNPITHNVITTKGLVVDDTVHKERLGNRKLDAATVEAFDCFYKSPRFVDSVINIT